MKRFLLTPVLFLLTAQTVFAQSIETGIDFYEDGNYEQALRIFAHSDSPTAILFTGKSYFALNNFLKAKHHLNRIDEPAGETYLEAKYTLALADFQLKNFASSLDVLYELKQTSPPNSISRAAASFYSDLLNYLTLEQRLNAFRASVYDEVRLDLVESAIGVVELGSAQALFNAYKNTLPYPDSAAFSDTQRVASIEKLLADTASYRENYNPNRYTKAPDGLAYNIGVALPEFDLEAPEFEISQQLYFGIQLAIETFNSENTSQKAFLSYNNTSASSANAAVVANNLAWNHDVDVIIGPLFSEVAVELAKYAELYQIPLLTPLANSDRLNIDLNYTFQLNPTFTVQGQRMAQYAVQTLGFDTLAVLAERGSLGEPSAVAFLDESRRLGAEVVRYYVEDLESQGYDISEYVKYFDPKVDTVFNYNIDAVYAPFTGTISETLINALLTNLEAMETKMSILGSEEWEAVDLSSRRLPETQIYYTKTFERDLENSRIEEFQSAFRLRFDMEPNRFAYIGFDATNVVLSTLKRVQNPAYLKEGLKNLNNYRGLITDVSFRNTHINQEVKIKRIASEE